MGIYGMLDPKQMVAQETSRTTNGGNYSIKESVNSVSHGGIDAWQRAGQSGLSPHLLTQACGQTPGSRLQPPSKALMLLLNLTVVLQFSHLFSPIVMKPFSLSWQGIKGLKNLMALELVSSHNMPHFPKETHIQQEAVFSSKRCLWW